MSTQKPDLYMRHDKDGGVRPESMNTPTYLLNVYLGDTPMGALMMELSNHGLVPLQTRTHDNVVVMQFDERPSLLAIASIHENLKATIGYFEAPVNKGFWLFASSTTLPFMMPDGTFTQINS